MKKKIIISFTFSILIFTALILFSKSFKNRTIIKLKEITEGSFAESIVENTILTNEFSNSKEINNFKYEIIPQTAEKRLSLVSNKNIFTQKEIDDANKLICYEYRITNLKGENLFKEINSDQNINSTKYFTNDMKNDLVLILEKDTIACQLFHFERTFGITPYLSFQIGFPYNKEWKNKSHHIVFNDNFFNNGEIHLINTYK